ncbi:hypothetical protein T492DRAFT_877321 [Pavlovales sp. CCMP2436]|nr:hypothetical protein T492DRAFT_877321 [Pavlovales sp. CCMP2436]
MLCWSERCIAHCLLRLAHPLSVSQGASVFDVVFVINRPTHTGSDTERARAQQTWRAQLLETLVGEQALTVMSKQASSSSSADAPGGGWHGVRYITGNSAVPLAVYGPYSSSFPLIGSADQALCIGLGSGCVAMIAVYMQGVHNVLAAAVRARGAGADQLERRRRALEAGMGALGTSQLARAGSRVEGEGLSTHGSTLRERCASVRWLLAAELARLAFVAISLAAAFLTLSWNTTILLGGTLFRTTTGPLDRPPNLASERYQFLPPLFYVTFGLQASFLAYALARLLRGRGEQGHLIVTDYPLVIDVAYALVGVGLHTLLQTNVLPPMQIDYCLPWAAFLVILPFRIMASAGGAPGSRSDAEPVLQRASAIWVVKDISSAQSLCDLLARALVPLLRNAPAPILAAAHELLRVTIHRTSPGLLSVIASASDGAEDGLLPSLVIPPELSQIVNVEAGRPDFSARLSAPELLSALEPPQYENALARGATKHFAQTRIYFCGNPSVSHELAQLAARENVVSTLAGLAHYVSFSGESFSAGLTQLRPKLVATSIYGKTAGSPPSGAVFRTPRGLCSPPPEPYDGIDGPSKFGALANVFRGRVETRNRRASSLANDHLARGTPSPVQNTRGVWAAADTV